MIRIDEIYYNTFWTWFKHNNLNTRMLFCDPPGSSSQANLKILKSEEYDFSPYPLNEYIYGYPPKDNKYLYFHDQEPIHTDVHYSLFNAVIDKTFDISNNIKITQGIWPRPLQNDDYIRMIKNRKVLGVKYEIPPEKAEKIGGIVSSELHSDSLQQVLNKYGWQSYYYFFHGWASLDWYRGYHRSFLIPRAKDRSPTKSFISPNRIIGGKRDHRVLFLYHLFKNSLDHNHTTSPKICPEENVHITEIAKKYINVYPDIIDTFNNAQLPQLFKNEETQLMSSCWITNHDESADSLFYVPTETVYFGRRWHLTEKTFKPIVLEMPFILVAPAGSLEYLRSYGFKTFSHIIDESYDEETNDILRLEKIAKLLTDIDKLSTKEKQQIHRHCLPIVEHNYNHFYFGNFEGILWKELTGMMQEWL